VDRRFVDLDVGRWRWDSGTGGVNLNLLDPNHSGVSVTSITATVSATSLWNRPAAAVARGRSRSLRECGLTATWGFRYGREHHGAKHLDDTAGTTISITVTQTDKLLTHDSGAITSNDGLITLSADEMTLRRDDRFGAADVQLRPTTRYRTSPLVACRRQRDYLGAG